MHTRALYWAHKVHHRSVAPDPLSAFSFHPLEGLLTGGFIVLMAIVFHVHVYTLIAANAYGIITSVLIHSGYEVFPRWWYENRLSRWYITPTFHDRHHSRFRYNFGGFLTVWDRLFGTTDPNFDAEYKRVTSATRA
jgi:lathosterol oxidase